MPEQKPLNQYYNVPKYIKGQLVYYKGHEVMITKNARKVWTKTDLGHKIQVWQYEVSLDSLCGGIAPIYEDDLTANKD